MNVSFWGHTEEEFKVKLVSSHYKNLWFGLSPSPGTGVCFGLRKWEENEKREVRVEMSKCSEKLRFIK